MRRIFRHAAMTAAAIAALVWLIWAYETALRDPRYLDGWILTTGCLAQVLFSVRRKLPLAPFGNVATWMQVHLYMGYFLIAAFAVHTRFELPDGVLETALWCLFMVLALSGITGAFLTRTVPAGLVHGTQRIEFEDIPEAQLHLARRVDDLVLGSPGGPASAGLSELYASTLQGFLTGPRNLLAWTGNQARVLGRVYGEIENAERYADEGAKQTLRSIRELVAEKHQLDGQYARQWLLRAWLFVHIPATYGMIIIALAHIAVVYAFATGVP